MKYFLAVVISFFALAVSLNAEAGAIADFESFVATVQSGRADFEQSVFDANGKQTQKTSGTLAFTRPGKFRWTYEKPAQLIVGDGKKVSFFDKDLNQVTVRKLDRALGASPAALLAGSNEIDKSYTLKSVGAEGGLDWLEATPRTQDTAFERIRLGFGQNGLEAMELKDQFGQMTVIKFADLERNVKISPDAFKFTPPKGAAVISE